MAPDTTLQDTLTTAFPALDGRLPPPQDLLAKTGRNIVLLFTRFPVGLFWFITIVTMLSVGLGTAIIGLGLVVLTALLVLTRFGASLERQLIGFFDGQTIEQPYRVSPGGAGVGTRVKNRLTDVATYRDLLYLFLQFPMGVTSFVWLMVFLFSPLFLLVLPVSYWFLPDLSIEVEMWGRTLFSIDAFWKTLIASFVGGLFLVISPFLLMLPAIAHLWVGRGLLGPTAAAKLAAVEDRRQRGVSASMGERKRIERDLHDGAQQQLVAVAMNLGRAQAKFDEDPEGARELVDSAQEQTKSAISELRNLARGIMPAVLTDRGLDAALSSLAEQSPLPVQVTSNLNRRLPESIESTAYFVVSEALTNAAKHGGSLVRVTIDVEDRGNLLAVEVTDTGPGGAKPEGPGLTGLSDRVISVGGQLLVEDGQVRGTVVRAVLPCE